MRIITKIKNIQKHQADYRAACFNNRTDQTKESANSRQDIGNYSGKKKKKNEKVTKGPRRTSSNRPGYTMDTQQAEDKGQQVHHRYID